MEVVYTLIPGMIFIGLVLVVILVLAVKRGQYDDLEGDGNRILLDEDEPLLPQQQKQKNGDRRNWPDAD